MSLILIAQLLIGLTFVTANDTRASTSASKALEERVRVQQSLTRFNLEIHVHVSPGGDRNEATPDFTASVQRDGSRMLRVFQQLIILSTERCTITVDRSKSLILYAEHRDIARTVPLAIGQDGLAVLESLTRRSAEPVVTQTDDNTWFVEEPTRLPGQKVRLAFDRQSHLLKEVAYLPRVPGPSAPGAVLVQYEWKDPAAVDLSQLSEERFVIRVGDHLEPANDFKGFQIKRVDEEQTAGGR